MHTYLEMLAAIESDPVKHLGNPSCEKLEGFVFGWEMATPKLIIPEDFRLHRLRAWIVKKYGMDEGDPPVFYVVRKLAKNDRDAFYLLFKELAEFRKIHPHLYVESEYATRQFRDRQYLFNQVAMYPGMYLGGKTVSRFRGWLDGDAYTRLGIDPAAALYADMGRFEEWLKRDYPTDLPRRCETLALACNEGDELKAFPWLVAKIREFESFREG